MQYFQDMTTSVSITSSTSTECILFQAISKLRDQNWNTALRGLAEVVEICRVLDNEIILPHMPIINQRLIELIKCARSHVSRTACQAVGPLFEYVKDTRRPEFDELVNTLLYKTADANKFIQHDANLALDCMVTHVGTYHAVRAISSKGPDHKNPLVRIAAARLMVCAVVIAGPEHILHPHNNEYTRKRIILNMVKFLEDKCHEARKFGQRLYKLLYKDRIFDIYLKRYLERDVILRLKKCLKPPQ
ncbi:TOG array regulator of axonemal microtubules protein 2-like [Anoplophora glabripennis]|uniref:TOG array regulator of axonemal microtubules protein 2-like n=1 Tax=Anoplophora glabripennis TaxID=217634 RepID=UPI0008740C05|nr:TOG array regulator of axonemal microtubules protein 2-like [Anoplophora glabripennis]